jgi:hypothetical protein
VCFADSVTARPAPRFNCSIFNCWHAAAAVNVANKDRAAHLWCENTTKLTEKPWAYVEVLQTAYKQLQPTRFEDLLVLEQKKFL